MIIKREVVLGRSCYRLRQFFLTLRAVADPEGIHQARSILTPSQLALFTRMQPGEQAHAMDVYHKLVTQGETSPDLLVAALLHDVGKSRYPLHLWERVLIVLVKALFPTRAKRWGAGAPFGWRRPFVIAEQHPAWGAEMATRAGASPLTVELICKHQHPSPSESQSEVEALLQKLQAVDDES